MCCLIDGAQAQLEVINNDFASLNSDISLYTTISASCPDAFPLSSLSPGAQLQFFIATSNHPPSSGLLNGQYAITVGQETYPDAGQEWSGYFNIFVTDELIQGLFGQASDLGGAENPDGNGIVIHSSVFGGPGFSCTSGIPLNTSTIHNLGRIGTHEVGHYFGLKHIFEGCNNGDDIDDTPNQDEEHRFLPNFDFNTCTSNANSGCDGVQCFYMNYMDYTNDISMVMFTAEQADVMEGYGNLGAWKSGTNNYQICFSYSPPILTSTNVNITCPITTFDLSTLNVSNPIPCHSVIRWSEDSNANDGLSSIISTPIVQSGTYYAYYYNSVSNCYGPSQNVTVQFNCCDQPDITINSNTTYNTQKYVGGNIIINAGKTLTIDLTKIIFKENKGIVVKNGGSLFIKNSTLDACNITQSWSGIKIESGGIMNIDNGTLKNVAKGIDALSNSSININKATLVGKGKTLGTGINLDGNVNSEFINNLDIKFFQYGIKINNSNKIHAFIHGEISNTSFGIVADYSSIKLEDYVFKYTKECVNLYESPQSSILNSKLYIEDSGIYALFCHDLEVSNCNIINFFDFIVPTYPDIVQFVNPRPAISVLISENFKLTESVIVSSNDGVLIWGSINSHITTNIINAGPSELINAVVGPLSLLLGGGHTVDFNTLTGVNTGFAINSSWTNNNTIINNNVSCSGIKSFRVAAIKATGNVDEVIDQNIVTANKRAGILVQNTTGNQYYCNEITTNSIAHDILYNSEQQLLKANTFDGGDFDMVIKSEIGIQATTNSSGFVTENNGNVFLGGSALAEGLLTDQLFNSQFPFNPFYLSLFHKPSNPVPASGWFIPNNVTPYANCNGLVIGNNFIFGNDPTKICAYWNYLKSIRLTKPELFFVKLVHLLKYAKLKPGFILPNCIKLDPVFLTLCGVTKLADVSVALTNISANNINTTNMQALQIQYNNASTDAAKSAIVSQMNLEMNTLHPLYSSERNTDISRLDSLKNELNTIICTSIIVNKWKEILKIYIDFIQQGKVQQSDKAALESYSTNCSDLYGEAIHLARAMVNTYNNIYYDENDGCFESAIPRITLPESEMNIIVSPNPTTGNINIEFSYEFSGTISIHKINGQKIISKEIIKSKFENISIQNQIPGLYVVKTLSDTGISREFKTILIK